MLRLLPCSRGRHVVPGPFGRRDPRHAGSGLRHALGQVDGVKGDVRPGLPGDPEKLPGAPLKVRPALARDIVKAHSGIWSSATGVQVDANATSDDAATTILDVLGGASASASSTLWWKAFLHQLVWSHNLTRLGRAKESSPMLS